MEPESPQPPTTPNSDIDRTHVLRPKKSNSKNKKIHHVASKSKERDKDKKSKIKNKSKGKAKGKGKGAKKKKIKKGNYSKKDIESIQVEILKDIKNSDIKKRKKGKKRKSKNKSPRLLTPTPSKKRNSSKKEEMLNFTIPANLGSLEKLQLIYSKLSNAKLPSKKRREILKTCSEIIGDEKCEAMTAKFAVDGFKKVLTEQLKDKKFAIHEELYRILKIMISSHYKKYKNKNIFYLKLLMNHIGKIRPNEKKQINAVQIMINTMIERVGLKDKKQLILMMNEFIRNGTSSKNKMIKEKAWNFLYIALDEKSKQTQSKLTAQILDCVVKGIKGPLSNNDKLIQLGSFKVLAFLWEINEIERVEKLYKKMSVTAQKQYNKKYPNSSPTKSKLKHQNTPRPHSRKISVGQYALDQNILSVRFLKRRDSLERIEKNNKNNKKKKNQKKKKENQ